MRSFFGGHSHSKDGFDRKPFWVFIMNSLLKTNVFFPPKALLKIRFARWDNDM